MHYFKIMRLIMFDNLKEKIKELAKTAVIKAEEA